MRVIGAGRTILTIAHRLSTVKTADRIIVMADGMIIEDGTAQTLSQRIDGVYAQLLATTRQHHGEEA
jgi:ABC-type multidrug transport system fused ATPase/permease subunit